MRIVLLGPYPDFGGAIGGISMHLKRLRAHLLRRGHQPIVYTEAGRGQPAWGVYAIRDTRLAPLVALYEFDALVHMHMVGWKLWALVAATRPLRRHKTILTVHGDGLRMSWAAAGERTRAAIRATLRRYDHIVAVNDHVAAAVHEIVGSARRVSMIPAFVPPVPQEADRAAIPDRVWRFVDHHRPLVSMNGWVRWYCGREDLYGFDLMLHALRELRSDYPRIGVVVALCGIHADAQDLWAQLQALAHELDVAEQVCWIPEPCEYYPILQVSDAMLRPTRTDGWPVSIGEALYFGVPVVASDVCARPPGTVLFRSGDARHLADQLRRVLAGAERPVPCSFDCHLRIMELYERLAAGGC